MIEKGWLEETRGLLDRYGELSETAAEATGYAELIAHLKGKMALEKAAEQIKIGTRQLARRQMKWFRRWRQVSWLPGDLARPPLRQSKPFDDHPNGIASAGRAQKFPFAISFSAWFSSS